MNSPFRTHLRYDGLAFALSSPVASHLQWVEEFLCPHFTLQEASSPHIGVELVIDPGKFREWENRFSAGGKIQTFVFDSQALSLSCAGNGRGGVRIYDDSFRVFYDVSKDRRSVRVLIAEDRHDVRTPLLRILREYAMNEAQQGGDFFLHASCFISGENAFVITGPKNAGKTTLLIHGCRQGGARYLANDRVRVGHLDGRYALRGMPAIVSIRKQTFAFFPEIRSEIMERGLHFRLHTDEGPGDARPPVVLRDAERWLVTPMQFCSLMRTRQVAEGGNPAVIVPHVTGRPGTFSLSRLRPEEAHELLEESLFGARYFASSTPVFNSRGESGGDAAGALAQKCRRFAERVPFFRCLVGVDLYRKGENAGALMQALREKAG